ncbi:hypothetical protein BKA70DRAFT_1573887 [Coprinopsis sp. MPI-PUGE-AT-0042]|nr:hypothetical protein BKA70DRAFT_1573887 [Coprinopsis sp. MPI-PUGE-AT-0042]
MSGHAAVPTEILSEIFQQSLPHTLDQEWSPGLPNHPLLTCNIGDEGFHDGYLSSILLLDAWFSRAGESIPLELEYLDPVVNSMRDEETAAMKNLIQRYQPRWKRLSLFIEPESFWDVFFDHPPSGWVNLHTLSLFVCDFIEVGAERAVQGVDALENMTSLQCLLLQDHAAHEFERRYGPIDLPELHISLDGFTIDQVLLISAYQRLTKLVLVAPPRFLLELSLDNHITLPSLSSLSYNTYDLSLLEYFTTPALAESLYSASLRPRFICRDNTPLIPFAVYLILPSLSERPDLNQITFDIWPFPNELSRFRKDSHPCWCPHLRELTVSIRSREAIELERVADLAAFLKRREELGLTPLESLTVHRCSGAVEFPYELFQDVSLGKLCVMVPV